MRSLLPKVRRLAFGAALVPCALLSVACGGANRDAMEKRVANLQDELTRLQNTNDRLAERVQALEIVGMRTPRAPEPAAAAEPEETRVARPVLKVVKLAPGAGGAPVAAAEPEAEPGPAPAEEPGPRPVIKDHGAKGPPAWKAAPRAGTTPLRQTGGPARPAPKGT
jgi:hypothetical protein